MTNNARPRHAAQGRASRIAGRTALGALAAPMAMLAVAGPAGAAALDLDGVLMEDGLDIQLAANDVSVPALDSLGLPTLPTELPALPLDGLAFEGVSLDLFDLAGAVPALPGVDELALPSTEDLALPGLDSLPIAGALAAVPVALPGLPEVGDLAALPALPEVGDLAALPDAGDLALPVALPVVEDLAVPSLPGTDALPELPELPDAVGTVTGLAGGLPVGTTLDLDEVSAVTDAVPAAADVFSATDLVQGLI